MKNQCADPTLALQGVTRPRPLSILFAAILLVFLAGAEQATASTPTTTTLTVTAGGSAVTTVPALTVIQLTATVKAGTSPVTPGQVNFCDATALYCTDIHLLGTAQLTSAGTAVMKFRPGTGDHSYKAVFLGTASYATSSSSDSLLTVSRGKLPVTAAIAVSGSVDNYTLTGTLVGTGGIASPTGTVSFLDTSNGNSELSSAPVGSGTVALNWMSSSTLSAPGEPFQVAVGDFNGDGIPDMAVSDDFAKKIRVFLGKGDGTFTAKPNPAACEQATIVVADLNGDGNADLALACQPNGTLIQILLGNGDGTFKTALNVNTSAEFTSMAVGEFNGDGIPDLVLTDWSANSVTVLLGNGDGTFTAEEPIPAGIDPQWVAVGDFNGDGKQDLAVANYSTNSMTILLGNGDGTFTTAPTPPGQFAGPWQVVVGDFNGDGKEDLAVTNIWTEFSSLLLGNGDGTFNFAYGPEAGWYQAYYSIALGDFNHDGNVDLALGSTVSGVSIFMGNGDGTFSASSANPTTGVGPDFIAVADFNGDGLSDLATSNSSDSTASVVLSQMTQTFSATAGGIHLPAGTGTHLVEASYQGDSDYESSVSGTIAVNSAPYQVSLSATSLSFGNEAKGYSTPSQEVVLSNLSNTALDMKSVRVTGTNASQFVTSNTCGATVAAGTSCRIGVRFVPSALGVANAAITLSDSASNSPQAITLSGTGITASAPPLTLSVGSLSFGTEPIGDSTNAQNVTVTNIGSTVLYFKTIQLGGANPSSFVTSNTCGGSVGGNIAPGASCRIGARFLPTVEGAANAAITLTDNAPDSPQTIALSGTGIAAQTASLSLSDTFLSLGDYPVTGLLSTVSTSVTVTNTGTDKVYFKTITLGGANASSFITSNTCGGSVGGSLAPGAQCRIGARFKPITYGYLTATITLTDNAADSPQTITLTGIGQ
jgi:hypothetical protein